MHGINQKRSVKNAVIPRHLERVNIHIIKRYQIITHTISQMVPYVVDSCKSGAIYAFVGRTTGDA
jgi:hypothetical protein